MCDPLCDINTLMKEQDEIENRLDFGMDGILMNSIEAVKH